MPLGRGEGQNKRPQKRLVIDTRTASSSTRASEGLSSGFAAAIMQGESSSVNRKPPGHSSRILCPEEFVCVWLFKTGSHVELTDPPHQKLRRFHLFLAGPLPTRRSGGRV